MENEPESKTNTSTVESIPTTGFEWIGIYKTIAEKISDENTFLNDVLVALDEKGLLTNSFYQGTDSPNRTIRNDVDPFSFFALFNFNSNKRKEILKVITEKINKPIKEENKLAMPPQFSGIPHIYTPHVDFPVNSKKFNELYKTCLETIRKKGEYNDDDDLKKKTNDNAKKQFSREFIVTKLEQLFRETIKFNPKQPGGFSQAFDAVKELYGNGWFTTTSVLFEIRPDAFLPLDSNTRAYLKKLIKSIDNWPSKVTTPDDKQKNVTYTAVLNNTAPNAAQYLAIINAVLANSETIKQDLGRTCPDGELFAQISYKAWKNSSFGQVFELLEKNGQVILHGAPGTGKTFLAEKTIAPLLASPDEADGKIKHIRKVQFHPGYDYSDFIVGMKPTLTTKDGEELIRKADELHAKSRDERYHGEVVQSFRWQDGVFKKIADDAKRALEKNPMDPEKFVLIIDEINRADLSNVFGEVFSCIERSYRYRYSFEESKFENSEGIILPSGDRLVVPQNLYIIGTMNDIDRSVESIDFALRRRFAWKEIKAKDTQDSILAEFDEKESEKLNEKMKAVNEIIVTKLDASHELGAAYFANLGLYRQDTGNYTNESYDSLWSNHLEPILKEYLRGEEDAADTLTALENAYKGK